jgi:ADP-ribose pyrophosphatase YjhB (NUDIX family)
MDASKKTSPVVTYPDGQFRSGTEPLIAAWLPDSIYSQALDALVIACADVAPVYRGQMLIGHRAWPPQADWWIFGGRMQRGELYQQAAARNILRELFHGRAITLESNRFRIIGVYNLIWDQRAQEPSDAGCQHLSVTMMIRLTREEANNISLNEEYSAVRWIAPDTIIAAGDAYHPCLVQMARDVRQALATP